MARENDFEISDYVNPDGSLKFGPRAGVKPIPDLEFQYPDCTVCDDGGDMNGDPDSIWCEKCGTYWRHDGTHGKRDGQTNWEVAQ